MIIVKNNELEEKRRKQDFINEITAKRILFIVTIIAIIISLPLQIFLTPIKILGIIVIMYLMAIVSIGIIYVATDYDVTDNYLKERDE